MLITEYADGGTLRKTIKNTAKLFPWYLRISMARDIAAGMVRKIDREGRKIDGEERVGRVGGRGREGRKVDGEGGMERG